MNHSTNAPNSTWDLLKDESNQEKQEETGFIWGALQTGIKQLIKNRWNPK